MLLAVLVAGCSQKSAGSTAKSATASTVPNPPKEDQLNTFDVGITAPANVRLGIETTPIEKRPTQRKRMYGGEVTLPTGASLIVTAPLPGFLHSPPQGGIPKMGERVHKGQPIYELRQDKSIVTFGEKVAVLQARLTLEQARTDADNQVEQTQIQLDAAQVNLERAERLLRADAGTKQRVDDAKAARDLAEKAHEAALSRKKLVDSMHLDEGGMMSPLVIEAPQDGIIRVESATAGEAVAAGAPLFEVVNLSVVWVKVPVYVGEEQEIAKNQPAHLSNLEDRLGARSVVAPPVKAPPTALALSSTVDLYYEIENPNGQFRPGQKVNANLALNEDQESLVIPYSAVVTDINGGTWVYEVVGEHKFSRRRVQIKYVAGELAVLASGPPIGSKVVTQGAAELFGTEMGFAK
jgi:RND family efflux transporter MFP subunit